MFGGLGFSLRYQSTRGRDLRAPSRDLKLLRHWKVWVLVYRDLLVKDLTAKDLKLLYYDGDIEGLL